MTRKVRAEIVRRVRAYQNLRGVSWWFNELAHHTEKDRHYHCMVSMVFAAFTLEAALNHFGQEKVLGWTGDDLKRKLNINDKRKRVGAALGMTPDMNARPWKTFKAVFDFRNLLAHAVSEVVKEVGEFELEEGERLPEPLTEWERQISLSTCQEYLDDSKAMLLELGVAAGMKREEVLTGEVIETRSVVIWDSDHPSSNGPPRD